MDRCNNPKGDQDEDESIRTGGRALGAGGHYRNGGNDGCRDGWLSAVQVTT
jgi:hypothetical protein